MNNDTRNSKQSTSDHREAEVVVIGGGLAGLTAAATIASAGRKVVVREKLGVPGGNARSVTKDGFTFNHGPHAIYRNGPAERILTDLGIRIAGGTPPVKGRIVMDGAAHVAPAGAPTLLRTTAFPLKAKVQLAKMLARLPRLKPQEYRSISAQQWIDSMVTEDSAAQYLTAIVRLTSYSNQPTALSADAAIGQVQTALASGVCYVDGGWQTLVDQLTAVPGVEIQVGEPANELPDARAVIIAAGGPSLAGRLLQRAFDVGPPAKVSVVDYGLSRRPDHDVLVGGDVPFYFSNHSAVAELAPDGCFHAAGMQYLAPGDDPDHTAIEAFARHAGIDDDDIMVSRRLHQMTAVSALPTAALGGLAGRPRIDDTGLDNVFIAGDWVGSDGILADAAVSSGKAAGLAALAKLDVGAVRQSA